MIDLARFEPAFIRVPRGVASRVRLLGYRLLGLRAGSRNRMERVRCRRLCQIVIGSLNAFTEGCWLWPVDERSREVRIRIGSGNYFSRDVMIDASGLVEIGDENMFGPGVFITDSNHDVQPGVPPHRLPMRVGRVRIGNGCWIGAHAVILKDVEIGHGAVVAAGAVVTRSVAPGSTVAGVPARPIRGDRVESSRRGPTGDAPSLPHQAGGRP
jgi:acetyltransferase-like isoleucine patch superfamily enzyme